MGLSQCCDEASRIVVREVGEHALIQKMFQCVHCMNHHLHLIAVKAVDGLEKKSISVFH